MPPTDPAPRTDPRAILAFLLGLLALPTFGATALPALAVGIAAFRSLNAADPPRRGRRLTIAGLALAGGGVAALLLGLLILTIVKTRANSAATVCRDHLRSLGEALIRCHDKRDFFPPGTIPAPGLSPDQRLSWLAALLSDLDPPGAPRKAAVLFDRLQPDLGWQAEPNRPVVSLPLPAFRCPADRSPPAVPGTGPTNYLGIAGLGPDAAALPLDAPHAGFFGYDRRLRRADVARGLETTFAAVESSTAGGPWAAGGPATVRPVDPAEQPSLGPGRPFGGLHSGGANALFADGHVAFIRDGIEPAVWQSHALLRPE